MTTADQDPPTPTSEMCKCIFIISMKEYHSSLTSPYKRYKQNVNTKRYSDNAKCFVDDDIKLICVNDLHKLHIPNPREMTVEEDIMVQN